MRLNECEQVQRDLSEHLGINLTVVDASQQFLDGLKGIENPEKKRKFIGMFSVWSPCYFLNMSHVLIHLAHKTEINLLLGGKFIDIFEAEAKKIEEAAANSDMAGKIEFFLQ